MEFVESIENVDENGNVWVTDVFVTDGGGRYENTYPKAVAE